MLKCNRCGKLFEENEIFVRHDEYGQEECCPYCHDSDLEEVTRCHICREWTPQVLIENDTCPKCCGEILKRFRNILINTFTEKEIEIISSRDCF